MTATHPTRTRRGRQRRDTTGVVILILLAIGALKTWPIQVGLTLALAAAAVVVHAIRPRRLAHLWALLDQAAERRRTRLPTPGHRTLATFLAMNPTQFEHAIAALAREDRNVTYARQVGQANDRGADVLIQVRGRRILIQCKHHQTGKKVGGDTIREIAGSVLASPCHAGAIITTTGYTSEAIATNVALGRNALALIDGHQLVAWANGHTPPPW